MERVSVIISGLALATALFAFKSNKVEVKEVSITEVTDAASYAIDASKSSIKWVGKKKLVESTHYGHINVKSGSAEVKGGKLVGGMVIVDMKSLTNDDLTDPDYNAKLVGHLKNADFFDVEKYPTAKIEITGANDSEVMANLTIKGKTEKVKFPVSMTEKGGMLTAKVSFSFDRSKFDVRYGSDSFFDNLGDSAIDDMIALEIVIVATK